jgi:hypothetical protein
MTRQINIKNMPAGEHPLSEEDRITAEAWADADAAASLLGELKSADLEERKSKLIVTKRT